MHCKKITQLEQPKYKKQSYQTEMSQTLEVCINNFDLQLDLYKLVFHHYLKKQQTHNPLDLWPILRGCKGIYLLLKNTEDICSRIQNWNHQFALFSVRNMHWHYEYSRFLPICHTTMHHICRTCKKRYFDKDRSRKKYSKYEIGIINLFCFLSTTYIYTMNKADSFQFVIRPCTTFVAPAK